MKFVMNGPLYLGSKPVMWSPVEKTALAEAEVEYHDHAEPDDLGEVSGREVSGSCPPSGGNDRSQTAMRAS